MEELGLLIDELRSEELEGREFVSSLASQAQEYNVYLAREIWELKELTKKFLDNRLSKEKYASGCEKLEFQRREYHNRVITEAVSVAKTLQEQEGNYDRLQEKVDRVLSMIGRD